MNIFIMGAPGSGKGTFSAKIKEAFDLNHISTGDIFRANIANGTPLGIEAQKYMKEGNLVPDEITNQMVADYLKQLPDRKHGYLLDGYPRTLAQAKAFEDMTRGTDQQVDLVLSLDVPKDVLTKRITGRRTCPQCGEIYNIYYKAPQQEGVCDHCHHALSSRADDNPESLKVRLKEYDENTYPVISFYEDQGKVRTVNADRDVDAIWQEINNILNHEQNQA